MIGRAPVRAFVGLGANLGDAKAAVLRAADDLSALPGIASLRLSPLYRSAPVDAGGPNYVNAAAELQTERTAPDLLKALLAIELAHGRERPYRHAPRTLDLDLLLYGEGSIDSAVLTVPHPRLHQRAFVLLPLRDLAPTLSHPRFGGLAGHLAAVADQRVERLV